MRIGNVANATREGVSAALSINDFRISRAPAAVGGDAATDESRVSRGSGAAGAPPPHPAHGTDLPLAAPRRFHLFDAPRPIALEEPGARAVRQQHAARLAAR